MPRCQRTFRRLPPAAASPTGQVCPFCPEAEAYEMWRREGGDGDDSAALYEYADNAYAVCVRDFGAPPDHARSFVLVSGLHPECVLEPDLKRYEIYLQSASDAYQLRLQIGHEMFHRVCSRGRVFHWTHEALACLQSVRLLREQGLNDYADQTEARYHADAARLPLADFLASNAANPAAQSGGAGAPTAAYYGRAFVTAQSLERAAGWPALRRLPALAHGSAGAPIVARWASFLPPDQARAVRAACSA